MTPTPSTWRSVCRRAAATHAASAAPISCRWGWRSDGQLLVTAGMYACLSLCDLHPTHNAVTFVSTHLPSISLLFPALAVGLRLCGCAEWRWRWRHPAGQLQPGHLLPAARAGRWRSGAEPGRGGAQRQAGGAVPGDEVRRSGLCHGARTLGEQCKAVCIQQSASRQD